MKTPPQWPDCNVKFNKEGNTYLFKIQTFVGNNRIMQEVIRAKKEHIANVMVDFITDVNYQLSNYEERNIIS